MSKLMELHYLLKERFPGFTGITRFLDGRVTLSWESPPSKVTETAAQAVVDDFDWTEKPEPTEAEVDSKISFLTTTAKQALIEQMLKQYLLGRPDLVEKL